MNLGCHAQRRRNRIEVGGEGAAQPVGEAGCQFPRTVAAGEAANVVGLEAGVGPCFHD